MKILKNKILIALIGVLSLSVALFAVGFSGEKAYADITPVTEYTDSFGDAEISKNWELINETGKEVNFLNAENDGLTFNSDFDGWLTGVGFSKYKITKACRVEFITTYETCDSYFSFYFGSSQPTVAMPWSAGSFIMSSFNSSLMVKKGDAIVDPKNEHIVSFSPLFSGMENQYIKTIVDFAGGTNNNYDITFTVEKLDGTVVGTSSAFTSISIPQNSYFGFNASHSKVCLVSFKIFEGDEQKIGFVSSSIYDESENKDGLQLLNDGAIMYSNGTNVDAEWVVAGGFDETSLSLSLVARLDVSNVNTSAVYAEKYQKPVSRELEELYTLSADVITQNMDTGVASGYEIGKESIEGNGTFAGITKGTDGKFYLVAIEGTEQNKVLVNGNITGKPLVLTVYYDNSAVISVGDYSLTFTCSTVEGYFAITTVALDNASVDNKGAEFDNFVYKYNEYKNVRSDDLSINFDGVKRTYVEAIEGDLVEYYINKKDWRLSIDVIVPEYTELVSNNSIVFPSQRESTYFGPNYKYKNFIVRFDVKFLDNVSATGVPKFGLQFGMEETDTILARSKFLGFQSFNAKTYAVAEGATLSSGASREGVYSDANKTEQLNIFQKNKTYSVMYVAMNNSIKAYLKVPTGDGSEFEILRSEIKDVDTQGYLQVFANQNARLYLDNFSVINLDYNMTSTKYNGNGYEILRADFSKGDKLSAFNLEKAEYTDNSLLIKNGGYVQATSGTKNEIFRFITKSAGGDIVFEQGGLQIKFEKTGDKVSVTQNGKSRGYNLSEKINFDGALFEVYKMGNSVTFGFVNKKDPTSRIKNNQITVNLDQSYEGAVKLYSNGGDTHFNSISVFDLKPSVTIAARDYNPEEDYKDPWTVRPSIQEMNNKNENDDGKKKGCGADIASVSGVFVSVAALASAMIIRRKKYENS